MLNHPNIVKLIKLLDDPDRGCCYMVIEYVSGGELFDYIVSHGRLREKDARKFIRQVCREKLAFLPSATLLFTLILLSKHLVSLHLPVFPSAESFHQLGRQLGCN
jgi:serine/threonine protein kinase